MHPRGYHNILDFSGKLESKVFTSNKFFKNREWYETYVKINICKILFKQKNYPISQRLTYSTR